MKTLHLLPALCAIAIAAPAVASSTEFTFAPAPITQRLEAGENAKRLEFSYLTIDIPDNEWRGYGMNFTRMPALTASVTVGGRELYYGYYVVIALMVLACLTLYRLFKRSGWL